MIGRGKMDNQRHKKQHRAECIEHSVNSSYPMRFALCYPLGGVDNEDFGDGRLRIYRE